MEKELEKLREKIFTEQFYDYDDGHNSSKKADNVLKAIQNIGTNPMLVNYVLKCLTNIGLDQHTLFYIVVLKENPYKENAIGEIIYPKVFHSELEAISHAESMDNYLGYRYSIREIN